MKDEEVIECLDEMFHTYCDDCITKQCNGCIMIKSFHIAAKAITSTSEERSGIWAKKDLL